MQTPFTDVKGVPSLSQPASVERSRRPPSRRDRNRAATTSEIKTTARRMLVEHGAHALSLRGIAREMGITAPAIYRYFDSHATLVEALVGDLYDELCDEMEAAQAEAIGSESAVDDQRAGNVERRLLASAREFRAWSIGHPAEFALVFGAPIPGVDLLDDDSPACAGG